MENVLEIGPHKVGPAHRPKVIAELGINHGGNFDVAIEMATAAILGGAHFIKHQTHLPEFEMSIESELAIPGNADKSIYEVISECSLSLEEELRLASHITNLGGVYFSTPFSREAADYLAEIGVPAFKIGSGECNNYPLVEHIAKKGLPVILSTGMNSIKDIAPAVEILRRYKLPFALMHTTNLYPTPQKLLRLGALDDLRRAFPDAVIGLSDHSVSNSASFAAVALGASLVERHFTDSKERQGPDIVCSMDQQDLRDLLSGIGEICDALGGEKGRLEEENVTRNFAFASVAAIADIKAGETFTYQNIFPIRPAGGDFGPLDFESLVGKKAANDIKKRTQLRHDDVRRS